MGSTMPERRGQRAGDVFGCLPRPRRQNLAERVARILKRYILTEGLGAGDRLPPERRLAEALNVSRTVLREALSRLIGEGIVVRESPRVLSVTDFDRARVAADFAPVDDEETETRDLIELRTIIEIGAIEAIVRRATTRDLEEIERWVVEGERRLADHEPLALADARFHAALLRVLGNRAVDSLLPLIEENLRQSLFRSPHQLSDSGSPDDYRVVAEHRRIFAAIKRRDVQVARLVMEAHLVFTALEFQPADDVADAQEEPSRDRTGLANAATHRTSMRPARD